MKILTSISLFIFLFILFSGCGESDDSNKLFSTSSAGTPQICTPGASYPCYDGTPETMNLGQCRPGFKQCIETGLDYGFCQGQVLPKENETCDDLIDNNCNGVVDKDCMPACIMDQDCSISEMCRIGKCQEGYCVIENLPSSTVFNLTPKDCKKERCDGSGNLITVNDDSDTPSMDCYNMTCSGGKIVSTPAPQGTNCNSNNGHSCDGAGNCIPCNTNADCELGKICQFNQCI